MKTSDVIFEGSACMSERIEMVKQWLRRYLLLMEDVDSLILRADTLRDRAASPQSPIIDGLPHNESKNADRIGSLIALCDSLEAEAKQKIVQARGIYRETDIAIKKIQGTGSAAKKLVLQMRYLDGFEWQDINGALWLSKADFVEKEDSYRRRTFKIHETALLDIYEIVTEIAGQDMNLPNLK